MLTDGTLTLRHPHHEDAEAIYEACQDPEIPKWTSVPCPYPREHATQWIERTGTERAEGRSAGLPRASSTASSPPRSA